MTTSGTEPADVVCDTEAGKKVIAGIAPGVAVLRRAHPAVPVDFSREHPDAL
ncbi:hypothetical protein GCM10009712_01490 [Pseudarthrobacter sulfonivorans]